MQYFLQWFPKYRRTWFKVINKITRGFNAG